MKGIYICCSLLADEYKNSGAQNLRRIFEPLINYPLFPHIIILDEINILTDKLANANDTDRDMAVALWQIIDELKGTPHKLIATANTVDKLPAPLKDRFARATFEIPLPSLDTRKAIIKYWLKDINYYHEDESTVINFIANHTHSFSARMLKSIIEIANEYAAIRSTQFDECTDTILIEDARRALIEMKKSAKLIGLESEKSYQEIMKKNIPTVLPYVFSVLGLVFSAYGLYQQAVYQEKQLAIWQLNIS